LRIRIIKRPSPTDVEGYDVRHFEIGGVYDVGRCLADLLVISGYALVEMRLSERGQHQSHQNGTE
jgi:hypothetical protein